MRCAVNIESFSKLIIRIFKNNINNLNNDIITDSVFHFVTI